VPVRLVENAKTPHAAGNRLDDSVADSRRDLVKSLPTVTPRSADVARHRVDIPNPVARIAARPVAPSTLTVEGSTCEHLGREVRIDLGQGFAVDAINCVTHEVGHGVACPGPCPTQIGVVGVGEMYMDGAGHMPCIARAM